MELEVNFKDLSNLNILIKFARIFSRMTDLIFDINDIEGRQPKKYYTENEENIFCRIIRRSKQGNIKCLQSGKEAGLKARMEEKPYINKCYAGLIDVYVPIFINKIHVATLCTGQFLLSPPKESNFNKIKKNLLDYDIDFKELRKAYLNSRVICKEFLINYIDFMDLIVNYIFEVEDKIILLSKNNKNFNSIVYKAVKYIEDNYYNKIYIEDAAKNVYVSKYYLEHIFKKEMKISFIEYLNRYRVSRVKNLLLDNKSIDYLCHTNGFNSISHFYKVFKQYTGISPKKYREKAKKNLSVLFFKAV